MFDPGRRPGAPRALSALIALMLIGTMAPTVNAEVLSLDGQWEIVFDPANEGREARWFEDAVFTGLDARRSITVPSAWELIEEDYEGVAFYRKAFDAPAEWKDQVVHLQFGAVNYICEVWLNGEAVGVHEGGFTPFEFRVDRVLKPGEANVLLLRVVGPIFFGDKKVDGIGQLETPQWRGGISGGVWQSVQLYATGPAYVEDVYLKPDLDGSVELEVELNNTGITKTEVGGVIRASGVSDQIAAAFGELALPGLLLPFLMAMALTTATGSLTVAMVTSSAVVAPLLPTLGLSPEMAVALIGAGSLSLIHANSSFFWLLSRLHGVLPDVLYRTFSVQSLCMGLGALFGVLALRLFGVS